MPFDAFLRRSATSAAVGLMLVASPGQAESVAIAFEFLCDRTIHYFNDGIGNQIEYTSPEGGAYLWFPDTPEVIVGTWDVFERDDGVVEICFEYPANSFGFDGLTINNSEIHCFEYGAWVADIQEDGIRDGDPFQLASGEIPFMLQAYPRLPSEILEATSEEVPRGAGCAAFVS
ncbi:MAG: hypothetical protein AAF914_15955 [Pseudomonadota bacterium]